MSLRERWCVAKTFWMAVNDTNQYIRYLSQAQDAEKIGDRSTGGLPDDVPLSEAILS